uniref:Uncharacterized protein n=1 Tax=Pithovirus LCPAC403 TaxID=2506596 RepID=A0A481ZC99_9VIRU|nr:MAG: hypothetical protein LCPAC403_02390 [Pithovirus LCPAC403]
MVLCGSNETKSGKPCRYLVKDGKGRCKRHSGEQLPKHNNTVARENQCGSTETKSGKSCRLPVKNGNNKCGRFPKLRLGGFSK